MMEAMNKTIFGNMIQQQILGNKKPILVELQDMVPSVFLLEMMDILELVMMVVNKKIFGNMMLQPILGNNL